MKKPTPDAAAKLAAKYCTLPCLERAIRRAIAAAVKAERERNAGYVADRAREYVKATVVRPGSTSLNSEVGKHIASMAITIAKGEA